MNKHTAPLLRHQLTIAFRNFNRQRSSFAINLIGLWSGLTCVLLIGLWVNDELNVDAFHKNDARLFQVMERQQYDSGVGVSEATSGLLVDAMATDLASVEAASSFSWEGTTTVSTGTVNVAATAAAAGKDFFKMFSFDVIAGQAGSLFNDKYNVVISQSLAEKLFGSANDAVGKAVELAHKQRHTVSGVFRDVPTSSTIKFDLLFSWELWLEMNDWAKTWGNTAPMTFVLLKEGVTAADFNKQISNFVHERDPEQTKTLFIRKFSDGYLHGDYSENGAQSGGRIEYVRLFSIIGGFVLLIACINFTNLSTARASRRMKEVGIKKVSGAGRWSLASQFVVESMLIATIGVVCSLITVYLLLPSFNLIVGKQIVLMFEMHWVLPLISLIAITGLLAGAYPAFYLSSFMPSEILRGSSPAIVGEQWIRKGLVVFQFAISVIMISSVLVVYEQIEFIQRRDRGYDTSDIIYFPLEGRAKSNLDAFLTEIRRIPGVEYASASSNLMIGRNSAIGGLRGNGKEVDVMVELNRVNYDLIELMHIQVKEGRSFDRNFPADTLGTIYNEAAMDLLGLKDPIGQIVNGHQVIGVVKNYHFESLHEPIHPSVFIFKSVGPHLAMIRLKKGLEQQTLELIGNFYKSFNPGFVFGYNFLDEHYHRQYASEQRVSALSKYFAATAIIISCLGLFGLAAFTAERRMKEIGIRKVLGSTSGGIVWLLSLSFAPAICTAIIIALPVSYFIGDQWLAGFQFHIDLHWWYFAIAGLAALVVAWITIGLQTYRAARVNPSECLRSE